jgi:hypothetical protein
MQRYCDLGQCAAERRPHCPFRMGTREVHETLLSLFLQGNIVQGFLLAVERENGKDRL